jgi:hypothetical protein
MPPSRPPSHPHRRREQQYKSRKLGGRTSAGTSYLIPAPAESWRMPKTRMKVLRGPSKSQRSHDRQYRKPTSSGFLLKALDDDETYAGSHRAQSFADRQS